MGAAIYPKLPYEMTDLVAVTQTGGRRQRNALRRRILKSRAAIDVVHVPFKGIPEALTETMTGRVHFFMAPIANALAAVKDGRLTALGVSSLERDALLPDVPTVSEAGVAGYQTVLFGLLAPRGCRGPCSPS